MAPLSFSSENRKNIVYLYCFDPLQSPDVPELLSICFLDVFGNFFVDLAAVKGFASPINVIFPHLSISATSSSCSQNHPRIEVGTQQQLQG